MSKQRNQHDKLNTHYPAARELSTIDCVSQKVQSSIKRHNSLTYPYAISTPVNKFWQLRYLT